jgi:superfamily I DNA/RNA helicase
VNLGDMERARRSAVESLVNSPSRRRLVVAGPGTGKTYAFKEALSRIEPPGLALTFIRSLVGDLSAALGDLADVNTFHSYSKFLCHKLGPAGITDRFDFYPPLPSLIALDLSVISGTDITHELIDKAFQTLDDERGIPGRALTVASYYDAASFIDVVYRVFQHLVDHPHETPKHPLIVIDEYQDFTSLETAFIAQLAIASPVLIAGDDDQALYSRRHATPAHIRALAGSADYERHELPYCSRCTEVIVAAVNEVIRRGIGNGNLGDRLEKPYVCYLPDKAGDSQAHPRILDVRCSVQNSRAPYMPRYIAEQIRLISSTDIAESVAEGYPTVLVVGPGQFVRPIHDYLKAEGFSQAELRESTSLEVEALDGYRRIARDEASRLGWRILIHIDPPRDWGDVVRQGIEGDRDLNELIPDAYRRRHLRIASLVRRILNEDDLDESEIEELVAAVGILFEEVVVILRGPAEDDVDESTAPESPEGEPTIFCTTLVGAKGLSAGHVFVVGCNDGHFPRDPNAITDDEVCQLLVALSRTRKQCHLISCLWFGAQSLRPSRFLHWVSPMTQKRVVNQAYWR